GRRDPLVELAGNDVVRRRVRADQVGEGAGGGQLHVLGDRGGPDVQRRPEDTGEGQRVVDLVGEVAAAGRQHRVPAGDVRVNLRVRVGEQEGDGPGSHRGEGVLRQGAARQADEHVRAA